MSGDELRNFLRNPIDSRLNYSNQQISREMMIVPSTRSNSTNKVNKDVITHEWEKRFTKMKLRQAHAQQNRIVEPFLLFNATAKSSDPLHRLSVEEIVDLRTKNTGQIQKRAQSQLPQLRKIGASLRTNPITRGTFAGY
ncbi:hypothetical protein TVAG_341850 [Trichomonas vaginalis G3]|uniref:Uncharacterized protein n=1 Tax=Trichomonas vaginalis (strain ATCC PRA-98 / G3) TaxID=412133 RepID=A2GAF9_TRIV3|nr:hypothetical protein TVAGG3_0331370 [Trichomonas vaginalis G3]EAX85859.1 hypothetical protein TVAG_341850 [Trichomonas vaginalis G3]KAI5529980.1 hypothetical protein TVAGG3_0331370 [Trichomonas vaginalis G3]|eukprot:XP_001298789.1 hypothetical protein [Trichomonas vaginalis G3]